MQFGTIAVEQKRAERRLRLILKKVANRAFRGLPRGPWQVDVRMVGAALMKRLNTEYRNKDYATDILSFPAPLPFQEKGFLGELIVCLPTLKTQAQQYRHHPAIELDILLIHGFLHLLGMDHERGAQEAKRMARWESRILEDLRPSRKASHPSSHLGLIDRADSGI